MSGLTAKQEAFCIEYVKGGSKSFSDAYRAAFSCAHMKPSTINTKASVLAQNGKIRARIDELRAEASREASVTLVDHLRTLEALRDSAAEAGQYSAAVKAEIARGKASGLYVDRQEISGPDGDPVVVLFGGQSRVPV